MASSKLLIILLCPLLGSILSYLIGLRRPRLSGWVATAAAAASFSVALHLARALPSGAALEQSLGVWFAVDRISIPLFLRFDALTAVMCLVVTGVGGLIHLYAIGYMATDVSRPRFFAYFNLFLFAMLLLVLAGNLALLFAGWEGVGLCSYLLIGFWHQNPAYAAAGKKAFVVNRIGDAGFLIGTFLLVKHFGTLDFVTLAGAMHGTAATYDLIAMFLFIGAVGKSAQIPLFVWLPDAMAGPTPVSALIHAATMVTAGVYLLARMQFLFSSALLCSIIVVLIAIATAFVAATIALVQTDIKKVLAYSTISQLGFMFMAAGVGAYTAAIFHLVTHAFFKACLFLSAGAVIHGCRHEQDMRKLGGLRTRMPWTFAAYVVSTFAIAGVFPFAGYYSKHAVMLALEHGSLGLIVMPRVLIALVSLTAFLTAFYMTRSLVMTFGGQYRGEGHPHEAPAAMMGPVLVLAMLAACSGAPLAVRLSGYLGFGGDPMIEPESVLGAVFHSWLGILGILAAWLCYGRYRDLPAKAYAAVPWLSKLLSGRYFVDEIYDFLIVRPLSGAAKLLWQFVDHGAIDGIVNGLARSAEWSGEILRQPQTGRVNHYVLFLFVAAAAILVFGYCG